MNSQWSEKECQTYMQRVSAILDGIDARMQKVRMNPNHHGPYYGSLGVRGEVEEIIKNGSV